MRSIEHRLGSDTSQVDLLAIIDDLADDGDGILVQLPLPDQIDEAAVSMPFPGQGCRRVPCCECGRHWAGRVVPAHPMAACCSCRTILVIFQAERGRCRSFEHRRQADGAAVLQQSCTVTIAHSRTRDLAAVCAAADILGGRVGNDHRRLRQAGSYNHRCRHQSRPALERGEGKFRLTGDVDFDSAATKAAPSCRCRAVGPMTIARLLRNTLLPRRGVST